MSEFTSYSEHSDDDPAATVYVEGDSATFAELVIKQSHERPVLVDFWASWCGPCTMLFPLLEKVVRDHAGNVALVKINTDEEQALAMQYGVRSLPTVKLFLNGDVVDEFMGVQREETIRQMLERHLDSPGDDALRAARSQLEANNPEAAQALLNDLIATQPENEEARLALAVALLMSGDITAAQETFNNLSLAMRNSDDGQIFDARLRFATAISDAPDIAELERIVAAKPDDLQARYQLSAHHLLTGQFDSALQHLLEIMKRDRAYGDDLARNSLIAAFRLIDNPRLVTRYRQRMAALMF